MTKTTQQLNYAVQRHNANFDDWDTIRETITPLEARRPPVHAVENELAHPL
ncbi:MAG TPA: hypothetical protein VFE60_13260 [Roseiarcus sp.]|jgi:hypothetical protein|nr:hypothetical protein [Roseiarcus sp.]